MAGSCTQTSGGPAREHALMDHAALTEARSRVPARLCESVVLLLEARHGTECHLQPALLLGRGLRSQDHGHQRECLHKRGYGEWRQIYDQRPAGAPQVQQRHGGGKRVRRHLRRTA